MLEFYKCYPLQSSEQYTQSPFFLFCVYGDENETDIKSIQGVFECPILFFKRSELLKIINKNIKTICI